MFRSFARRKIVEKIDAGNRFLLLTAFAFFVIPAYSQPTPVVNGTVSPERLSSSFADVAKRVEPAVVSIDSKGRVPEVTIRGDDSSPPRDLEDFVRRSVPPRAATAVGSGFIVDPRGYILTNYHVVKDAESIKVKLRNGEQFDAKVIGADDQTDLAVLKIEARRPLSYIKFGNSDGAKVGEWVLAIGSPFGLARTVTAGIISQTNRETPDGNAFQRFIQTDAAINRGNSGGPLVDMAGQVIGVNSQIATTTGDYNGIGFALPSNEALKVYQQIVSFGKVKRGYLGVYLDSVGKEFAKVYGLSSAKGAIVTSVRETESAAARAGMRDNDIIVSVEGEQVDNAQDLISKIASLAPGKAIKIGILRESGDKLQPLNLSVRLDERPGLDISDGEASTRRKLPLRDRVNDLPFGLTLREIADVPSMAKAFGDRKGLYVSRIEASSFLNDVRIGNGAKALVRGDLIQRINRKTVGTVEEFKIFANSLKPGDAVVLHVSTYASREDVVIPRIVQFTVK